MKVLIILIALVSVNAFALDMTAAKNMAGKAVEKAKTVADACKKEQVEYCKAYTELAPLKECLTKNKEKLSQECKTSMSL